MTLHFERSELAARVAAARAALRNEQLDALIVTAQESHYYLTGFDTSGFVFFQCAVLTADDATHRSADAASRSRAGAADLDHRRRAHLVRQGRG